MYHNPGILGKGLFGRKGYKYFYNSFGLLELQQTGGRNENKRSQGRTCAGDKRMQINNCVRCGHTWFQRKLTRPDRCAKCVAKYWWRPKRVPRIPGIKQRIGRPNKYPVHVLNVGQTMTIPDITNVLSFKQSIAGYEKRHGARFELVATPGGYRVRRVL
jgi:hypothetical protein